MTYDLLYLRDQESRKEHLRLQLGFQVQISRSLCTPLPKDYPSGSRQWFFECTPILYAFPIHNCIKRTFELKFRKKYYCCYYCYCYYYLPPDQPVLTSHPVAPCFFIFSANMAAYLVGWSIIKAAPKHAENVACGSFIPSSVPATCYLKKKCLNFR